MKSLSRHVAIALSFVALAIACGHDDAGGSSAPNGGSAGTSGGPGSTGGSGVSDAAIPDLPTARCQAPIGLADVTGAAKVGDGSPGSCSEGALRAAVTKGGAITFDCGPSPHTIVVTSELVVPNDKDTILDGGGKVAISGGDTSRILALRHSFEKTSPTLTVQRMTLTAGRTTDASQTKSVTQGGAAIYALGGNVALVDVTLESNHGPADGQDVAGGAVFVNGAGSLVVVGSRLVGNTCSNGGAVGLLGAQAAIYDSVIANNAATGTSGNPGNGGNGGGLSMDGKGRTLTLCGAVFSNNQGNAFGGALFRTSYENEATTIDKSRIENNVLPDKDGNQAGGLYLQGTHATITNTSISGNAARAAGGVSVYAHGTADGAIDMTNVSIVDNRAHPQADFTKTGLVGGITVGDRVTGSWKNVTIAGNTAQFASGIGGASPRLRIDNSIVSNVAANEYTPLNCNGTSATGAQNLQWPANNKANNDVSCAPGTRADPLLGAAEASGAIGVVRAPLAGSPAFGLGKGCPPVDQLGRPRKSDGCTAGAIE